MQLRDGHLMFAPSDLSEYLGCRHASALALAAARGERKKAVSHGAFAQMIFDKGNQHEVAYLEALRARGLNVVDQPQDLDWAASAERTAELMRSGVDVIYQGVLMVGDWRGRADFLERVTTPSGLGDWSYEAVDTKLARVQAAPSHVLQLCFYSEGIRQVQGALPHLAHLQLGSGHRESIVLREVMPYYRRARKAFAAAIDEERPTEAYPCDHCQFCAYRAECEEQWLAEDSLTRVAYIRRGQVDLLRDAEVSTRTSLGTLAVGAQVSGLTTTTLAGLEQQARLQVQADNAAALPYEHLELEEQRGFSLLPAPSPGDVMFDLEGDPYWTPARDLTFLFGLLLADGDAWRYQPFWAHSVAEEKVAFEQMIDLIAERLARHPDMHVYHYSPAEPGAIKRLMAGHGTREIEVDDILRRRVMVDLLTVVRQALRVGVESYSLKQIERLAQFVRSAEVSSGAGAVLDYERYRETLDQAPLDEIAAYNKEDCEATLALRDWLNSICPGDISRLEPIGRDELSEQAQAAQTAREALRLDLITDADEGSVPWLAGELLEYHRREARPGWWRWFTLLQMNADDLLADSEAISGLEPVGPPRKVPHNYEVTLKFPPQNHKLAAGESVFDPRTEKAVAVASLDEARGELVIKGNRFANDPAPEALIPRGPLDNRVQRDALTRLGESIRDRTERYPALEAVLGRALPRFAGHAPGDSIQTTELQTQRELARNLDRSYLLVQGPPGTGKTYTGSRLIVDLIERGYRVGVTALSHRAINKLLEDVERVALEEHVTFRGARKATDHPAGRVPDGGQIENVGENAACLDPQYRLVGATTWLFSDPAWDGTLDYLVIDEAGQLSLADALAAGTSARNLILLGDPLQLPQVSQAVHPGGTNASVLEHLLGEHATVLGDRGIFLTETWRMHPDVCRFISDEVYEGRLHSHRSCSAQTTGAGTGLRFLPVEHTGNASRSPEEADRVAMQCAALIGQPFTNQQGVTRPLVASDLMVVAPYNAQVRLLRDRIPDGVRVGTVDAFQGQEAPVVIFSMATSSSADAPRELPFLFSRNRLNVAISRARCLAYLCCSPALLEAEARTVEEMKLISTLCSLVEYTGG